MPPDPDPGPIRLAPTRPPRARRDHPLERGPSPVRLALLVTAAFVLAGLGWVLLTDIVLYELVGDPALLARVETAKGWVYVALASVLLFALVLRGASREARKRHLLVTILESIGDGVLLLGRDRTICYANPAAARQLRCDRPAELEGLGREAFSRRYRVSYPDGRLVPPDQLVSQRVFVEGGPLRYRCVLHPPGVDELVVDCTGAAVRELAEDPPELVVSVLHDVTESEHLQRLRDHFYSAAAHALKTPLAVISAHARVFSTEPSLRAQRSAAAVERQCARMDALVQNLLVLSRARSGTLELHPRSVLLSSILERVARDRAVAALDRSVQVRVVADARAWVDDERVVAALRNLVDESSRASPAGPITLVLRRSGDDAELGVLCRRPDPADEPPTEQPMSDGDLAVGREVVEIVVAAHGGTQRRERTGADEARWVRLPALPQE